MFARMLEPLEPRRLFAAPVILFVRGALRSGGFLEGTSDATRNQQLADINNTSTAKGNAGWGTLAQTLRNAGFAVEQISESAEANAPTTGLIQGAPVGFEKLNLSRYAMIVFGSNNAKYSTASVDAIVRYINGGGGALFISDANFGSNWRDAADSDQQFLSRFSLVVNQDSADGVKTLSRTSGDFIDSGHPVLKGVNSFSGEGVSPITIPTTVPKGMFINRVVRATGNVRNNNGTASWNKYQGTLRPATTRDGSLVLARSGTGRLAGFFDRNTFFNPGGLGTDITKNNNRQLALNLFRWVANRYPTPITTASTSVGWALPTSSLTQQLFSDKPIDEALPV